jgi:hypothetical protein
VYDPNDPFWRDTEDDDDDMDYQPARGGSEDEDGEGELSFHGRYKLQQSPFLTLIESQMLRAI